jgi:hypothetical protein
VVDASTTQNDRYLLLLDAFGLPCQLSTSARSWADAGIDKPCAFTGVLDDSRNLY